MEMKSDYSCQNPASAKALDICYRSGIFPSVAVEGFLFRKEFAVIG